MKKVKDKKKVKAKKAAPTHNVAYGVDDYIIVRFNGKAQLGMCLGGGNRVLLEAGVEDENTADVVEFNPLDVLANLGKDPAVGKVFGVHVEPYIRAMDVPGWTTMRLYRTKATKEEIEAVKAAFVGFLKILKKHRADKFVEHLKQINIKSKSGKYAGMYRFKSGDGRLDEITLCPEDLSDPKFLTYVVAHEAAHGIWFRSVPAYIQAKWVKLFSKRITLHRSTEKELKSILDGIIKYSGTLSDYIKEMADETQTIILKEVISHIRKVHCIDKQDLDILCLGEKERLADLWPTSADFGQKNYDPSEYALTKPKEFFAECMSFYMTGRKLSKDITRACEITLSKLTRY
jgi:hypothetical protein